MWPLLCLTRDTTLAAAEFAAVFFDSMQSIASMEIVDLIEGIATLERVNRVKRWILAAMQRDAAHTVVL